MRIDRIEDLRAFVAVIERGSLTRPARHLGRWLRSVSRSLAAIEREVGAGAARDPAAEPTDAGVAAASAVPSAS